MALDPRDALRRHFGFAAFRPGQEVALAHALAGRDTLVVMPTGSGKSLVYQLAALLLPGTAVVVSPLIALMKDQVDGLARRGIAATFVNSSLSAEERAWRLRGVGEGRYKLVLVAPERLRGRELRAALAGTRVSLLAVDEAHCVSEWGHDFRPDYLRVAEARRELGCPVTLAMTATATPRVQDDVVRLLGLPAAERVVTGFDRPNLGFEVRSAADGEAKLRLLRDFLRSAAGDGIVYVGTPAEAEEVAEFVRERVGVAAQTYHGRLAPAARDEAQEAFLAGDAPVVVATNAFGMGIDRPDVRFVLHYSMPGTLEAYYQEAGRAGRDGLPARAVLLHCPKDRALQEYFIDNDAPTEDDLRTVHAFVRSTGALAGAPGGRLTLEDVERATGLRQVRARLALEQLEAAGGLRRRPDEAGGALRLEALPLPGPAIRELGRQTEARRRHRRHQLDLMVRYAETNGCRRRVLLDHFGDRMPVEPAEACCDNCRARAVLSAEAGRPAASRAEWAALAALDVVASLPWEIGAGKLARVLKGSRSKELAQGEYARLPRFGKLGFLPLSEIEALIDQLVDLGYLKRVGGRLPTLRLTPQGQAALASRAALPVDLPSAREQSAPRPTTGPACDAATAADERLFQRLRGWRLETARTAGLPAFAVFSDEALRAIAGTRPTSTRELLAVRGIGPAKAEKYGAEVLAIVAEVVPGTPQREPEAGEDQLHAPATEPPGDGVACFLARPHERRLDGPWLAGWALDAHSRFDGARRVLGPVARLVWRYKYQGQHALAAKLAGGWAELLARHPELPSPDGVVPIPPSVPRDVDLVRMLAEQLAARLDVPALPDLLAKTRQTRPQKDLATHPEKQANVAGAFGLRDKVAGKRLLLVDDLYDSGATLAETARALARGGAASIVVLALTKTIHADR